MRKHPASEYHDSGLEHAASNAMTDSVWGPGLWKHPVGSCVPGNHDEKLRRKLLGHDVRIVHWLEDSLVEAARLKWLIPPTFTIQIYSTKPAMC